MLSQNLDFWLGARRTILSVIREKPRLQAGLWNVPQGLAEDRVKGSLSKFLLKRDRKGLFFTAGKRPAKLRMASTSPQHVEGKTGECPEHFSGTQALSLFIKRVLRRTESEGGTIDKTQTGHILVLQVQRNGLSQILCDLVEGLSLRYNR